MTMWKTLTAPTSRDWLVMAMKCHASGDDYGMWLALLFWGANKDDCAMLGVCQGYKSPCVDCPNKV